MLFILLVLWLGGLVVFWFMVTFLLGPLVATIATVSLFIYTIASHLTDNKGAAEAHASTKRAADAALWNKLATKPEQE